MIKGKTETGFEYEIPGKKLKDWSFKKAYSDYMKDRGDIDKYDALVVALLGKEQRDRLHEFATDEEGCVDSDIIDETIVQICEERSAKNS